MNLKKSTFLLISLFFCNQNKPFLSGIATILDFTSVVCLIFKGPEVFNEFKNGTIAQSFINSIHFLMNNETSYVPSMKKMIESLTKDKNQMILDRILFIGGVLGASWLIGRLIKALIKKNLKKK